MISGVILAAGASERMGRPKQLLPVGGQLMLRHVVEAAFQAALGEIVVVIGHESERIRGSVALPPKGRWVTNLDHRAGMSTSLLAGLEATDPTAEAAVILMGDQPGTSPVVIRALVSCFEETRMPIVRAVFNDGPGPALLSAGIWEDLAGIEGDSGARDFIETNPDLVEAIRFDSEAPADIDTEEDYRKLVETADAGWEDTLA